MVLLRVYLKKYINEKLNHTYDNIRMNSIHLKSNIPLINQAV